MADHFLEHELLQHAAALRSLARALVGPGEADDLVQDAALQVLTRQPREPRGLHAFLVTIVRQLASKRRRSAARRQQREHAVARPEAVAAADRACERSEIVERLMRALLSLPEPSRQVLLQRFFEERPPTAIAARDGVPVETVKTRLKRALALLRERLDAESGKGGSDDWRAALAGAFGLGKSMVPAGGSAAAAVFTGAVLMGTGAKLVLGGAVVMVGALALLFVDRGAAPAVSGSVPAHREAVAAVAAETPSGTQDVAAERREVAVPAPPPSGLASAPAEQTTLRGRCVDEQMRPLAGVSVELDDVQQKLTTGADGRFECAFAPRLQLGVVIEHRGMVAMRAMLHCDTAATQDLGDIVLHPGARVRGRVADTAGTPIVGTQVQLLREDSAATFEQAYHDDRPTDASGVFAPRLPTLPGAYRLAVGNEIVTSGGKLVVPIGVGAIEHDVVVRRHADVDRITGIVVDGEGRPLERVQVMCSGTHGGIATDAEGRFEILRHGDEYPEGQRMQMLQKDGYERFVSSPQDPAIPWGTPERRFVMRACLGLEVRVVDAGGEPVTDYAIRAFPKPGSTQTQSSIDYQVRSKGHHDDGVVRIEGLLRGPNVVFVEPDDGALAPSSFVPVEIADAGAPPLAVRLTRLASRTVRLQLPGGEAVAGSRIELIDPVGVAIDLQTTRLSMQDWWQYTGPDKALLLQAAATGARGEALLRGPAERRLGLVLLGPGHKPRLVDHVELQGEALVVTVDPGARLVGHARPVEVVREIRRRAGLPEHGLPPWAEQAFADFRLPGFRLTDGRHFHHDAYALPAIPDADGTFTIDGMEPGTWTLMLTTCDAATRMQDGGNIATVTLRDGQTTEIDVDLSAWSPCDLEAVVRWNDEPLANEKLQLVVARGVDARGIPQEQWIQVTTDAAGHFRVQARQGQARLQWTRAQSPPYRRLRFAESVFLPAGGHVEQEFRLATGTVQLRVVDDDGAVVPGVPLQLFDAAGGAQWHELPATDKEGRTSCEAEARRFRIEVLPRRLLGEDARNAVYAAHPNDPDALRPLRLHLGEVTVAAGKTTELTVRLPAEWAR